MLKLRPTNELKALLTIVRDRNTSRHDFIFYAERLSRVIVERYGLLGGVTGECAVFTDCVVLACRSLVEVPFKPMDVTTPIGQVYHGAVSSAEVSCLGYPSRRHPQVPSHI